MCQGKNGGERQESISEKYKGCIGSYFENLYKCIEVKKREGK